MTELSSIVRIGLALSDTTRVRLLFALRGGELCVCQLIELVGLSPSTVSKHLSILRDAGMVESRKEGRWVHYRLAERPGFPVVGRRAPPLFQALERAPEMRADVRRLASIRKAPVEELCRQQRRS